MKLIRRKYISISEVISLSYTYQGKFLKNERVLLYYFFTKLGKAEPHAIKHFRSKFTYSSYKLDNFAIEHQFTSGLKMVQLIQEYLNLVWYFYIGLLLAKQI